MTRKTGKIVFYRLLRIGLFLTKTIFVFSKLFYCSFVRENTVKWNIHKLQLVQNFAARIVKKLDHISEVCRSQKWLNVSEKIFFNNLVLVFNNLNGLSPSYLVDYFTTRLAIHSKKYRKVWRLETSTVLVVWETTRFLLSRGQILE